MGGEGPAVTFTPSLSSEWAMRMGRESIDEAEIDKAYQLAKEFFQERKKALVDGGGWKEQASGSALFVIQSNFKLPLSLPTSIQPFFDELKKEAWQKMFRFTAKRPRGSGLSWSYFIDEDKAITDIFYLLQCIIPGMLVIYRIDDIDDHGELETKQGIPPTAWIEEHHDVLKHILGGDGVYEKLRVASADPKKAQPSEWISQYDYDNDNDYYVTSWGSREMKDFTACSSECGYCGSCDY